MLGVRLIPATIASVSVRRDLAFVWRTMRARQLGFPWNLLPSRAYLRWRLETAYGDGDHFPPAAEMLAMAKWARRTSETVTNTNAPAPRTDTGTWEPR